MLSQDFRQPSPTNPKLNNAIPVVGTNPRTIGTICSFEVEQQEEKGGSYRTRQQDFVPFFSKVYVLANRAGESNLSVPNFWEFNTIQAADRSCHLAAATVGESKTSFSDDVDVVQVRGSQMDGASL